MDRAFSSVDCLAAASFFTDSLVFTTQMGFVPTAVIVPKEKKKRKTKNFSHEKIAFKAR